MIDPVEGLFAWQLRLQAIDIPVLRQTVNQLARLGADPDAVDAQQLTEVILDDPLMTLRLLIDASALRSHRSGRIVTEMETVTAAVLMIGITSFYERYAALPVLEERLADDAHALQAVRKLIRRGARAARFASAFCAQRQDPDVAVVYEAVLLHDFAELLLWVGHPDVGRQIEARHREHRTAGVTAAQRDVMGFSLAELGQALMVNWSLPVVLRRLSRDGEGEADGQVRRARLAVRFARHTESGWSHPALINDLKELAQLLNLSLAATRALAQGI